MKSKLTLVEDVLNLSDDRYWFYIPGYNGYEVSNDKYIRSMKHYKKYPFGILIQPKKDKKGQIIHPNDPIYELSNNQNERVSIHLSEIIHLSKTNEYHITGYPRRTCITDISPRNQRYFIKNKSKQSQADKINIIFPKFTIIPEQKYSDIICPVESINGGDIEWRRK